MQLPVSGVTALAFCSLTACFALMPGPDMVCIVTRSVAGGRAAGWTTCCGIATAQLVHAMCAIFGISALLAASPQAYFALKTAGALYLARIGIGWLRHPATLQSAPASSGWNHPFAQGLMTNLFNPKVAVFAIAIIPQFIDAGRDAPTAQATSLCALWILTGTAMNLLTAATAAALRGVLLARRRWFDALQRGAGGVLVGMAVRLALDRPHA
ncbi:MAG TPA: LysE family translocator [Dokdonella sp.]|nr:LysE family translocator [Dokdonella sp.]